jgi:hypothetical protein
MKYKKGDILLSVIVFAAIAVTIITGLSNWGATMLAGIRTVAAREQALQIAEAGVDYYQWHLAQSPNDYKDGTTTPGPYVHNFYNRDGDILGTYSLTITPPLVGSTIVKIASVGTLASSTITRKVQESLAIPSLARFAVIADDFMNFGEGTVVNGPIQSNNGIHFDGVANNLVSSALTTATEPDSGDCHSKGSTEWAVYTQYSSTTPCAAGSYDLQPPPPNDSSHGPMSNRQDVFRAGRQLAVPAFDFSSLTQNLGQLQTLAQQGGKEWSPSKDSHGNPASGYHIVFKVDPITHLTNYDMYTVTALVGAPSNCGDDSTSQNQNLWNTGTNWGTWSISNQSLIGNYPIPGNGVIFVDDDVWVDGTMSNARITVASANITATSANNYTNITVNTNLKYTHTDGTDVIGLIAQGNINSGLVSDDIYEIDGALVAENGRVGRFYYAQSCGSSLYKRTALTLYGMIATAVRYGFAYSDGTGYATRNINYDGNLLYGPPPSFPQATTQYQVISCQQLQ